MTLRVASVPTTATKRLQRTNPPTSNAFARTFHIGMRTYPSGRMASGCRTASVARPVSSVVLAVSAAAPRTLADCNLHKHTALVGNRPPASVLLNKNIRRTASRLTALTGSVQLESVARFVVAAFRADAARAGAATKVEALVDELCRLSPEFEAMWRANDVRTYGEGVKHLRHPVPGPIAFEYSAFAVDGRPDLGMVIYNPATSADADRIRSLIKSQTYASV